MVPLLLSANPRTRGLQIDGSKLTRKSNLNQVCRVRKIYVLSIVNELFSRKTPYINSIHLRKGVLSIFVFFLQGTNDYDCTGTSSHERLFLCFRSPLREPIIITRVPSKYYLNSFHLRWGGC